MIIFFSFWLSPVSTPDLDPGFSKGTIVSGPRSVKKQSQIRNTVIKSSFSRFNHVKWTGTSSSSQFSSYDNVTYLVPNQQ